MVEKVITLSRQYESHGKLFETVTLREPKLRDHIEIGDPVEKHRGPDGHGEFIVEHQDRVKSYIQRLVIKPGYADILDLDLEDSLAVVEAVNGFFGQAHKRRSARTSSSGAKDDSSETSSTCASARCWRSPSVGSTGAIANPAVIRDQQTFSHGRPSPSRSSFLPQGQFARYQRASLHEAICLQVLRLEQS